MIWDFWVSKFPGCVEVLKQCEGESGSKGRSGFCSKLRILETVELSRRIWDEEFKEFEWPQGLDLEFGCGVWVRFEARLLRLRNCTGEDTKSRIVLV
ncbi:hypothetical protein Droror1_Dr00008482 [Drosera rotundifolia]